MGNACSHRHPMQLPLVAPGVEHPEAEQPRLVAAPQTPPDAHQALLGASSPWHTRTYCEQPCACCYYTRGGPPVDGLFPGGWRLVGGSWIWWHRNMPHMFLDPSQPNLGVVNPSAPRCRCCYYNKSEGLPPGPGWCVGTTSLAPPRHAWQWNEIGAPHAPLDPDAYWGAVADDARFMNCPWPVPATEDEYAPPRGVLAPL